jgi:aerobic carbon-monoxide dehydrogenase large subunit
MTGSGPREPFVGRSIARREDARLLTGAGAFIDDLPAEGALHVAFVRSPHASARIVSIDAEAARELPGVVRLVDATGLDLGPLCTPITAPSSWSPPRPLLADDVVRFAGEPVVAVVAQSPYLAEDAAELVEIEYEPLDAVADCRAAADPSAPQVHAGHANALYDVTFDSGGVDDAFTAAAVVVEREFRHPRLSASPIETRGVLAAPDGEGVRIWSSSQVPHALARVTASLLDLPESTVRVQSPDIGGGFGVKAHVYPEEIIVAAIALRVGRPVKWMEDRAENLLASSHARDQIVTVRAAADADGRLLAFDADILCDTGAYGVHPHGHILEALGTPGMLQGPYRLPAYRYRARAIATHKAPEGAYRGVGLPVSAFVHERLMDILAGELRLDRAEIRRRNLITADELPLTTHTGQRYDSGDYVAALELALAEIDYPSFDERRVRALAAGRPIGIGISCYVEYTGVNRDVYQGRGMVAIPGTESAHLRLGEDGTVSVWTTLPAIGQGTETTFAQLVADELDLDLEQVRVQQPDTSVAPLTGTGTFASRSAILGGGALLQSTRVLRERMLEDAAELLEADVADLRLHDGAVQVTGAPQARLSAADLLAATDDPDRYRISARFDSEGVAYPYATHVCEVEVDPETGAVRITRYVIAEDCGRVINPQIVEGQVAGATAQGIGGALLESLVYSEDGQLVTGSFMDYLLPTAAELPRFEIHHLQTPAPGNPTGAKGVGEGGTLAPPGAIAGAVSHALSAEFNELPLLPGRVAARLPARPA